MPPVVPTASRARLAVMFFLMALPMAMWFIPLGNVMKAYDLMHLLPWVLASGSVSAFISPLFIGSLADRQVAPVVIMRWLSLGTAVGLCLFNLAVGNQMGSWAILAAAMVLSLIFAPMWGLATSIVLSQLPKPSTQFGPVRAWATMGWMAGGWLVSYVLMADSSLMAGYAAAVFWILVALWTLFLPQTRPTQRAKAIGWWQILGLDALDLLKDRNHRMVFITAALYSMPLAAFYPYGVRHLQEMEVPGPSGVMTLGQVTEIVVMLTLAGLMRKLPLKWVFLSGIGFGLARYVAFSWNIQSWFIVGVALHGLAYTLYFITTQIYLEERIDSALRTRAQALLTLLTAGVGNLIGYLGSGWWYAHCAGSVTDEGVFPWDRFWGGLAWWTALVYALFAVFYKRQRWRSPGGA